MATANKRPLAVLNVKRYRRIGDFILKVRTVILNITNNSALFTTPAPTIIVVTDNLQKLEDAEATAQTRVAGSVAERNINYDLVLENIRNWIIYVQTLANNAPDEPEAIHIIESAGFDVKKRGVRVKAPLEAKQGLTSGTVKLTGRALGKRVSYQWQKSTDGTTFTALPSTIQAKTTVNGLTPGTDAYFRYRGVTKLGEGDWSSVVSLIVV